MFCSKQSFFSQRVFTFVMLDNLMEDKQLNFNRPLISVRRGSSTSALAEIDKKKLTKPPSDVRRFPHYKPDLKSGPMSNPAAVPFKWEQIPGRAKDEKHSHKLQTKPLEQPPPAPKLPPGRTANNEERPSHKLSKDFFGSMSQRGFDAASISDESSLFKNVGEIEENDSSHSEGEDSTYLDALDTLSRSESSFLNCSMSGLDDPGVKSSRTSLDPQTRDFMMGRFLPAAKAVVSEAPHFGSRKQPVVKEQQVVISDKQTPRFYYTPTFLPQYLEDEREEEDEDEEEDNEYHRTENVSTKLCGLLPRFCVLSPIPGMKGQPPTSIPLVRKLPKKHTNSCIYDKCEKAIRDAVYERRRLTIYQKSEMRVGANDLNDELEKQNLKSASLKSEELASLENSSIVPYRSVTQQSLMSKGTGFLGIPEAAKHSEATTKLNSYRNGPTRFRELLADETVEEEVFYASPSPTVEKTLYIDSIQIEEYQVSNSRIHPLQLPMKDDKETILPLPLPKCPSESWLSHALPSMSSRRPLSKSYLNAKSLTLKPAPTEPKWEALVKSSSLHNNNPGLPGLMRISED